jgi:hypothetical protein
MKHLSYRSVLFLGLSISICAVGSVRTMGGGCAVSDGSVLPSDDGCMLAFVYNQTDDHRLVVIDEKNRHRYDAPLKQAKQAPFWEGGKVYVVDVSGSVQGFSIGSDRLVAEKEETISAGLVSTAEYIRSQRRLYLIRTGWDDQRNIFHELIAIDFPARKTLWTKRIDGPGLLRIRERYVCVMGLKLIQVFNCDTGEKIAGIEAAKAAAAADANAHK